MSYPSYGGPPPVAAGGSGLSNFTARFPVYAIDFAMQAAGKRVAASKRRIRWRWGFSNKEALDRGETGTACRGEEHDVTLVWSITSGKRQILMDGREINYSVSRSGIVDYSWTVKNNNVLKLVVYANPPLSSGPRFRQYDLLVNGQSFFDLPKVYELGVSGPIQAHARVPGDYSQYQTDQPPVDPAMKEQEDLQRAIQESLAESRKYLKESSAPAPAPATGGDLLDFGSPSPAASQPYAAPPRPYGTQPQGYAAPPAPPAAAYGAPPPSYPPVAPSYLPASAAQPPDAAPAPAPGALVPVGVPPNPYAPPPAQYRAPAPVPQYNAAPPPSQPQPFASPFASPTPSVATAPVFPPAPAAAGPLFTPSGTESVSSAPPIMSFGGQQPVPPVDDPFAPKAPTQNEIHTSILNAYGPAEANGQAAPMTPGVPPQPDFQTPAGATPRISQQPAPAVAAPSGLSMGAPLNLEESQQPKTEVDSALANLVNFDDISAPAAKDIRLTMVNEEEQKKKKAGQSRGLPPIANNMVGSGATLSQIQQIKPAAGGKQSDPSKIMKPPPQLFGGDAANAGALVVHGQGPPPLAPQGFGAGYRNSYY